MFGCKTFYVTKKQSDKSQNPNQIAVLKFLNYRLKWTTRNNDLFSSSVRKITARPQTVLNKTVALVTQMHGQCLHATSFDDSRFVARAHRKNCKINIINHQYNITDYEKETAKKDRKSKPQLQIWLHSGIKSIYILVI